jgi:hypothetical protein
VIATLGAFATRYMLGTTAGITSLRGKLYRVGDRRVVPVLHPAAALYNGSNRQVLFDDFRRLRAVLDRDDEHLRGVAVADGEALKMSDSAPGAPIADPPMLF